MEEKNKEILLNIFANALENKTYEQDNNKIMYVCNLLKDMEQKLPTLEEIEKEEYKDIVYDYIYDNVVDACVEAIENSNYEFAYNRYKESILSLEQTFLKPTLQQNLVRTLKQQTAQKV